MHCSKNSGISYEKWRKSHSLKASIVIVGLIDDRGSELVVLFFHINNKSIYPGNLCILLL